MEVWTKLCKSLWIYSDSGSFREVPNFEIHCNEAFRLTRFSDLADENRLPERI